MKNDVSEKLKVAFDESVNELYQCTSKFPWENRRAYAWWLSQTYYFVRHTTSFLAMAAASYGPNRRDQQYKSFKHLKEEMNHDLLAIDDIRALGYELEEFPELPETSVFYQSQYYYIAQECPAALMGYAMCLEGIAAKKAEEAMEIVKEAHGSKTIRFLKSHAVADQGHVEEGLENFDNVTENEAKAIIKNLKQSTYFYKLMIDEIIKQVAVERPRLKVA